MDICFAVYHQMRMDQHSLELDLFRFITLIIPKFQYSITPFSIQARATS